MWTYTTDSMDFVTVSTGLISPYWMGLPIRYIQSYDHLLKVDEYLSVPVGEDICEKCGSKMHIKKYQTKEELVYEPARLFVRVTHIPVLECEN